MLIITTYQNVNQKKVIYIIHPCKFEITPHWTVFKFLLHPHENRIISLNIFLKRFGISFRHKDYRTENRCVSNSSKTDEATDERKYKYDC